MVVSYMSLGGERRPVDDDGRLTDERRPAQQAMQCCFRPQPFLAAERLGAPPDPVLVDDIDSEQQHALPRVEPRDRLRDDATCLRQQEVIVVQLQDPGRGGEPDARLMFSGRLSGGSFLT